MSSMISGSSSCRAFDSEDEIGSWLLSSECSSIDDEDDLTLLNGDEDSDKDSITFRAYIELAARLKKKYNLREASVALERCDKIWGTMQLLKRAQSNFEGADFSLGAQKKDFNGESSSTSTNKEVPLIKYQPFQGTGNNGLPNFYLSVKSQKKIFNCTTCGKLYSDRRSMKIHMGKAHGLIAPVLRRKRKYSKNSEATRSKTPHGFNQDFREPERVNKSENTGSSSTNPEIFPCPVCHRIFTWRSSMRKHAQDIHNYNFYALPKSNMKKEGNKNTPPESKINLEPKKQKEAPPLRENGSKGSSARPRRACTANASYVESTVKDEEALARTYAPLSEPKSVKNIVPSSGTKCFLCSNYFPNIELHLRDYHRISKPNKVLPMADEFIRMPTTTGNTLKNVEKEKSNATIFPKVNHSTSTVEISETEKTIQELCRKVFDSKREREMVQCLMCLYEYADYSSARRHLLKKMVNGIVQEHEPWDYGRRRQVTSSYQEDVLMVDESLKSEDESRKRTCQPPEVSEMVLESKRGRIEDGGDGNVRDGNGRDEEDDEEEEKTSDQRDTRDSSDRDSGIGISITIKKRNNSYEIVDKDNSSEDTSKEGDTSVVDDSPSQIAAPLDPKKDTSRFDPLRFSENNEHKKNDLTNNNDDNDDITIIDCPHIFVKNDGLSDDYSKKDNNPCSDIESHKNQTDPIQSTAT